MFWAEHSILQKLNLYLAQKPQKFHIYPYAHFTIFRKQMGKLNGFGLTTVTYLVRVLLRIRALNWFKEIFALLSVAVEELIIQ